MSTNVVAGDFLTAELERRLQERQAAVTALEARERALTATCIELQEQVEGLMEKMEWKKEYDALRTRVREFANR